MIRINTTDVSNEGFQSLDKARERTSPTQKPSFTFSHFMGVFPPLAVAKEQGLRSRAAFKLSQIHRKFPILTNSNARVVLDLCAAPGGWSQVATRLLPSKGSLVLSVDILPIRSLGPNVVTLIGDITTDKCKADIRQNLQGMAVDVVLHDGAPNVGASYDKDAYEQNEIALHALRCATQHLRPNGHFVTKLYRSRDYASYVWVAQQFFGRVQAVKPNASRTQSAEIFLVCQNYTAPTKIDPRMLDPKHVFEQVEGDSTGGSGLAKSKMTIFHKQWDAQKRHRDGYDLTKMDFSMRKIVPVADFMDPQQNPIDILSQSTGLQFQCPKCIDKKTEEEGAASLECNCQWFLEHELTTHEIKACISDLKVLNKSDFKGLLTWRQKLLDAWKEEKEDKGDEEDDEDEGDEEAEDADADAALDSDKEEEEIQREISDLRQRRLREKKKLKKKERVAAAKRRRRAAYGMDLNAIDVPEHDEIFTLTTITNQGDLEAAREVDLDKVTHDEVFGGNDEDEDDDGMAGGIRAPKQGDDDSVASQGDPDEVDEATGYNYRMDRELDDAYDRYLRTTKNNMAKSGTKMAKRSKKLQRQKALTEAQEDQEMMLSNVSGIDKDTKTYAKMLQGNRNNDDSSVDDDDRNDDSDDDDDDGFHAEPLTPGEHAAKKRRKEAPASFVVSEEKPSNPLIHKLESSTSVRTARWFSNPLFESIGNVAQRAAVQSKKDSDDVDFDDDDEEVHMEEEEVEADDDDDDESVEESMPLKKGKKNKKKTARQGLDADDVLASMPKTDKQVRHERRLKAMAREERRQAKKARLAGEMEGDFELAPAARDEDNDDDEEEKDAALEGLTDAQKKKHLEARALIKAAMGDMADDGARGFEVVSTEDTANGGGPLPIKDTRKYDSDNEDYDSDDYAETLALGTMMLRHSKAKALVDASYNRYAWNDPQDLPDWFVDDERRFYRPLLPVPPALIAKMKEKVLALSAKPIAKVAEARARKSKRARTKLAAAKKKAAVVANNADMSETMKLKAISKAMRGQDTKRPGKTYVVAKKGRSNKGMKGVKLVDKRMRNDKRSMERSDKKKRNGKKGGLTGSKRRRHHS